MKQDFTREEEREQIHKTLYHSKTTAAVLRLQYSELCEMQSYQGKGQQGRMLFVKCCCNICFNYLGEEIPAIQQHTHSVLGLSNVCINLHYNVTL